MKNSILIILFLASFGLFAQTLDAFGGLESRDDGSFITIDCVDILCEEMQFTIFYRESIDGEYRGKQIIGNKTYTSDELKVEVKEKLINKLIERHYLTGALRRQIDRFFDDQMNDYGRERFKISLIDFLMISDALRKI